MCTQSIRINILVTDQKYDVGNCWGTAPTWSQDQLESRVAITATPQNTKRPQQLAQPDSFLLPVWLGRFILT